MREIHDLFDGSAHCIECRGDCRQTGEARELTNLVRHTMEFFAYSHGVWMPDFLRDDLRAILGTEFLGFHKHAVRNNPKRG